MNQIIPLSQSVIGGAVVQTANARKLHTFLESKQEFSNWIKNRIDQYGFVEDRDFTVDKFVVGRATVIDYHVTTDMAKELSMVERNAKGIIVAESGYMMLVKSLNAIGPQTIPRAQNQQSPPPVAAFRRCAATRRVRKR